MNDWEEKKEEGNQQESFHNKERMRFSLSRRNILVILFALVLFFIVFSIYPPSDFPVRTIITVDKGESLSQISANLKKNHIIRSSFLLSNLVIVQNGEKKIVAGDYYFDKPVSVFSIARRIIHGGFGIVPLKITFPEGLNLFELSEIARVHLAQFDSVDFLERGREKEGYLFPDTYLFLSNAKASDVILTMEANFEAKIKTVKNDITESGRSLENIIIMASIVEKEASKSEDRRIISGILWKRFDMGMALQVDSTFQYINGKNTYELSSNDLKIDSPYNTYKYAGLPSTPISNPGMDAIEATLHPEKTSYLYFLSDKKGNMYYAKTFSEHKINREKYLD